MLMVQTTVHHNNFKRANVNVKKYTYGSVFKHTARLKYSRVEIFDHIFIIFIPFPKITKME